MCFDKAKIIQAAQEKEKRRLVFKSLTLQGVFVQWFGDRQYIQIPKVKKKSQKNFKN